MPHCMVPLCTNGWRKNKERDITYHRLPTGPLKTIWLRNIRRDNPRIMPANRLFVARISRLTALIQLENYVVEKSQGH